MRANMLSGLIAAFLTSILFTVTTSLVFMNETYGFGFYFIAFLVYGAPAICLIGLPLSLLIETLFDRVGLKSRSVAVVLAASVATYAAAGFVGTWILFLVLVDGRFASHMIEDTMALSIFGIYAALLFLAIRYGVVKAISKTTSSGNRA